MANPETILVVEALPVVRDLLCKILEGAGYRVVAASSGEEAIQMAGTRRGEIDLLLSCVMLPDMSGPAVAELIKRARPDMRVILTSSYPNGEMVFLNYGWHFSEKRAIPVKLIERVKDVLSSPERSQAEDHFDTRVA